ncbi:hypothetical protein MKY09_11435 [Psychrobacillus sp. FSL K6-4046]|uniref:hypothetical protein n=1 Tax=Psychrobacillus sp. FSL K6-4046 TaxID=2921550 RepID=UPI003159EAB9
MALELKNYSVQLNGVGDYKQHVGSWSNSLTSCGSSMASVGCVITSYANLLRFKGKSVDPGQVLATLKPGAVDCPFVWATAGTRYGLTNTLKWGGFNTLKQQMFDLVVKQRQAFIVHTSPHTFVVDGFVGQVAVDSDTGAVVGIEKGMFLINDPGSTSRVNMKQTLDHYGVDIEKIALYN